MIINKVRMKMYKQYNPRPSLVALFIESHEELEADLKKLLKFARDEIRGTDARVLITELEHKYEWSDDDFN